MNPLLANWLALLMAAVATWAIIALMMRHTDILPIDHPNERSLHARATPRIGGLAVFPGIALAGISWGGPAALMALALAFLLFLVSILDDLRSLPPWTRLCVHLAASGAMAAWLVGFSAAAVVAGLAIAWMVNLFNFMDGANGLAGGMAVVGFGAMGLASDDAILAFAVVGAAIPFLRYNFDPARVFLGDSGSITLGFLAGSLGLTGIVRDQWPLWFPLLAFAPFVMDATVTLVRRVMRREKFWTPHREHYYQRLVRMGWSHRRLAFAEYGLMLACGLLALALLKVSLVWQVVGVGICLSVHVALMIWVDRRWTAYGERQ